MGRSQCHLAAYGAEFAADLDQSSACQTELKVAPFHPLVGRAFHETSLKLISGLLDMRSEGPSGAGSAAQCKSLAQHATIGRLIKMCRPPMIILDNEGTSRTKKEEKR